MYLKHTAEEITALRSALCFHHLPARLTASQHHSCKDYKIKWQKKPKRKLYIFANIPPFDSIRIQMSSLVRR